MTITYDNKSYTLTQNAYLDGTKEAPIYRALGVDPEGNTVEIRWDVLTLDGEADEACDWARPSDVRSI